MKRVAILRCLRSNDVCTGAGCMQAFNNKTGKFSQYGDEKLELVAFWSCNGCGNMLMENQKGLEEKIQRIISMKTDVVHVGVCVKHKDINGDIAICSKIQKIISELKQYGIAVVDGTH